MKIDISHVAKLANLPLTDREKKRFEKQLSSIIGYFEKLKEVNTLNVPPMGPPIGPKPLREDSRAVSLPQELALQNAKSKHNGFFKVKAILTEE